MSKIINYMVDCIFKEDKTLFQHIIAIIFTLIIMLMLHRALFILNLKSFFHKKENNDDN